MSGSKQVRACKACKAVVPPMLLYPPMKLYAEQRLQQWRDPLFAPHVSGYWGACWWQNAWTAGVHCR